MLENNQISHDLYSSETIMENLAANKIQKFFLRALLLIISNRRLMQNYESTLELAEAYNTANAFHRIRHSYQKDKLLEVANIIIETYCKINLPNKTQTLEIANLSCFDHESIKIQICNKLTTQINILYERSKIPDFNKIEAIQTMLSLLPQKFLSANNPDFVIEQLKKISDWLHKESLETGGAALKDPSTKMKNLLIILNIYAKMLDILLDNKILQQMNDLNSKKNLSFTKANSRYSNSFSKTEYKTKTSNNGSSSSNKSIFTRLCEIFCTGEFCKGDGLESGLRAELMRGIKGLEQHHNMSIRYLVDYITESISRIAEHNDTDLKQLSNRGKHLFLGASSFSLMVWSGGGSLGDFKELLSYVMQSITDTRMPREEWYNHAREIKAILSETEDSYKNHSNALEKIAECCRSKENQKKQKRNWQLFYTLIKTLIDRADNQKNSDIIKLAEEIAKNYCETDNEVAKAAITLIIESGNTISSELQDFLSQYPNVQKYLIENIENIGIAKTDKKDEIKNSLLLQARKEASPLEETIREIRKVSQNFCEEKKLNKELDCYVPVKYNTNESLTRKAMEESNNSLFIHGSPGIGKSLFGRYLEKKCWDDYIQVGIIPVFISKSDLESLKEKTLDCFLTSIYKLSTNEVETLKTDKSRRSIVIIDDYTKDINTKEIKSGWNRAKIIALTSSNLINSNSSGEHLFITKFNEEQVKRFISKRLNIWKYSQLITFAKKELDSLIAKYNLIELLQNPIILSSFTEGMLTHIEKDTGICNKIDKYTLYETIVKNCFDKKLEQIEEKVELIATTLFEKKTDTITNEILKQRYVSKDVVLKSVFFNTDEESSFAFINFTMQNFFTARVLVREIQSIHADLLRSYSSQEQHDWIGKHFSDSLINKDYLQKYPEILYFILDAIDYEDLEKLERVILSTRETTKSKKISNLAIAAANALTIYVRTRHTQIIGSRDWSNTQISGADISGTHFYDMDFSGCHWSNMNLESIVMSSCIDDEMCLTGIATEENKELIERRINSCNNNQEENNTRYENDHCIMQLIKDSNTGTQIEIYHKDTEDRHILLRKNRDAIRSMHANNLYIFAGDINQTIHIWDIAETKTKKAKHILKGHRKWVECLFSNISYLFSGSRDKTIRIWDMQTWKTKHILKGHDAWVKSICASDDLAFSGSYDNTIRMWDIEKGSCIKVINLHSSPIFSLEFDSSNNELISIDKKGLYIEWKRTEHNLTLIRALGSRNKDRRHKKNLKIASNSSHLKSQELQQNNAVGRVYTSNTERAAEEKPEAMANTYY